MKKLLGIVVLGLLLSGNAYAADFYLKGATPATLMEMGYKLFSVTDRSAEFIEGYEMVYTFVKDKSIVSCKVTVRSSRSNPYWRHKCYNITNIEND